MRAGRGLLRWGRTAAAASLLAAAPLATGATSNKPQSIAAPKQPTIAQRFDENFIANAAASVAPALVNLALPNLNPLIANQTSGSGFIVDQKGIIITNTHVVREALQQNSELTVTLSNGEQLQGFVEHADSISDIAIVRVKHDNKLPFATLGSSRGIRPGEFVVALGAPLGLSNTVTFGIVSAIQRTRSEILGNRSPLGAHNATSYIQTDAAINSGNSGGPLVNIKGEVIGVNTMKAFGMDGIAFAVPIDDVKHIVHQLTTHGRVLRPYLGLKFVELGEAISLELNERAAEQAAFAARKSRFNKSEPKAAPHIPNRGLYVMHVAQNSPAYRAGIKVGDTIVGIQAAGGGEDIELSTTKQLVDSLSEQVGERVILLVRREGRDTPTALNVHVDSLPR